MIAAPPCFAGMGPVSCQSCIQTRGGDALAPCLLHFQPPEKAGGSLALSLFAANFATSTACLT